MSERAPSLLVVTGLQKEADIATGDSIVTLCSGGDPNLLRERLAAIFSAHPGETSDPQPDDLPSRFRGNQRPRPATAHHNPRRFRGILSFGLAGGLRGDLRSGDVVVASHVVAGERRHEADADWPGAMATAFGEALRVHRGAIAGADIVLTNSADKAALHAMTGALAVDMESHIAAEYAQRHGLPFAAIRAISDPAHRSLPALASNALRPDGSVDVMHVIAGVTRKPHQIPALIAAGLDSGKAFASLRRSRGLLGPFFGLVSAHL